MQGFLHAIMEFPAVVFTVFLAAVMMYWAFVLASGIDLDDQGADGHGDGHHDADADGDGDGDAEGDADGDAHDHAAGGAHVLLDLLGAVELRRVPLTVRVSLVVIFAWLVSVLGWIGLSGLLPETPLRALLTVAALLLGTRFAGWAARPLVPVFTPRRAPSQTDLGGRDAEVTTGRVDRGFGQVLVHDGGAGLLVNARYDGAEALAKGTKVLVTHWDAERNVAYVEPLDATAVGVRVDAVTESAEGDVDRASSGQRPVMRRGQRPR